MEISQALMVREVEVRHRRDGSEYLKLALGDRTGVVTAMVWEEVGRARELFRAGEAVWVVGTFSVHPRFGPQLGIQQARPAVPDGRQPAEDLQAGRDRDRHAR